MGLSIFGVLELYFLKLSSLCSSSQSVKKEVLVEIHYFVPILTCMQFSEITSLFKKICKYTLCTLYPSMHQHWHPVWPGVPNQHFELDADWIWFLPHLIQSRPRPIFGFPSIWNTHLPNPTEKLYESPNPQRRNTVSKSKHSEPRQASKQAASPFTHAQS